MQFVPAICVCCKHFNRSKDSESLTCEAFPRGIPATILHSRYDHRRTIDGDGGVVFEMQDGKQNEFAALLGLLRFG